MTRPVQSAPKPPRQWRSSNLGLLAVGFGFLFACSLVPAGVLLVYGVVHREPELAFDAIAMPFTLLAAERLVSAFDARAALPLRRWIIALVVLWATGAVLFAPANLPGPGAPVQAVVEMLGPPDGDSRDEYGDGTEAYTLYFHRSRGGFKVVYVVDVENDLVTDVRIWSR